MPTVTTPHGIDLDYVRHEGDGPTVLLVMGLGMQHTGWPPEFVDGLVEEGFDVVAFDNRDVGLSTGFEEVPVPSRLSMLAVALRLREATPVYTVGDMAEDAAALLDALGIDAAHVVGASMGGMIAQHLAFDHPDRVLSLVSIMSTTGAPDVGQPTLRAGLNLMRPTPEDRAGYVEHSVRVGRVLAGDGPFDAARAAERAAAWFDRSHRPTGRVRQMQAVAADGDRTERLARIDVPTLVVHGVDDPLIAVDGGEATAAAIDGARLELIERMGHAMPPSVVPRLVDLVSGHVRAHDTDGARPGS